MNFSIKALLAVLLINCGVPTNTFPPDAGHVSGETKATQEEKAEKASSLVKEVEKASANTQPTPKPKTSSTTKPSTKQASKYFAPSRCSWGRRSVPSAKTICDCPKSKHIVSWRYLYHNCYPPSVTAKKCECVSVLPAKCPQNQLRTMWYGAESTTVPIYECVKSKESP